MTRGAAGRPRPASGVALAVAVLPLTWTVRRLHPPGAAEIDPAAAAAPATDGEAA